MPTTHDPENKDLQKALIFIGVALSYMRKKGFVTGRLLPDSFFEILQIIQSDAELSEKKKGLAEILKKSEVLCMIKWLEGDQSQKGSALGLLKFIHGDDFNPTDEEMAKLARGFIDDALKPYLIIASSLLSGISNELTQDLEELSSQEVSTCIQGTPLDAEKLIGLLHIEGDDPHFLQNVERLKERIRKEFQLGTSWPEKFHFCITAQRAMTAYSSINIKYSVDKRCRAQTCFNTLALPITESKEEEFFAELDLLINDESFSMA